MTGRPECVHHSMITYTLFILLLQGSFSDFFYIFRKYDFFGRGTFLLYKNTFYGTEVRFLADFISTIQNVKELHV